MSDQDTQDRDSLQVEAENNATETQNCTETEAEISGEKTNEAQNGEGEQKLTPETKIADLEAKLAETNDQLLRKAADFDNFRKRMNLEKQSAIEYANQSLFLDIIPVIDNFERAIAAGENSADITAFLDGVKMIEKQLISQLENKWGLKRYNSAGELFNPNLHEALYMEKSSDVSEAVVQEDMIKGYMLKERVIRAAKVKVLMPAAQ